MKVYSRRLEEILKKPEFTYFCSFNALKCSKDEKCYSYVPLTKVEVERSFSRYRDILNYKRQS